MKSLFTPPPPRYHLIAHRGLSSRAPENTLSAFRLAAENGFDWIEFDVQLTQDHALVIFHDDTLERTSNGTGFVYQHSLEYLRTLDAGSWFDPAFSGESIPCFSEILPSLLTLPVFLNIELKVPKGAPPSLPGLLSTVFCDTLSAMWPISAPKPLISSFDWELLSVVKQKLINFPIGYVTENPTVDLIEKIRHLTNVALISDYRYFSSELLHDLHQNRLPVLAYTVNEPEIAKHLLEQGVFAVFSDDPIAVSKSLLS